MKTPKKPIPRDIYYYQYLKKTLKSTKKIGEQETKEIFLKALRDYFAVQINLRTVSEVATQLYYEFTKPFDIETKFKPDLAKALSDATEVDWYHDHQKDNPATKKMYQSFFKTIKDYYEENKHSLKKTSNGKE